MNTLIDVMSVCLGFVYNVAEDISKAFTGSSSSKGVIIVIFYLILLIVLLWLLRAVVGGFKGLFRELFSGSSKSKSKRRAKNSNKTSSTSAGNSVAAEEKSFSLLKAFNKAPHLDRLFRVFEQYNTFAENADQYQPINETVPQEISVKETDEVGNMPVAEKEALLAKVKEMDLKELNSFYVSICNKKTETANKIKALGNSASDLLKKREPVVQKELSALNTYNSVVNEAKVLSEELEVASAEVSVNYTELSDFITNMEDKVAVLLKNLVDAEAEVYSIPGKVDLFCETYEKKMKTLAPELKKKQGSLDSLKKNYSNCHESRTKIDNELSSLQTELNEVSKEKAVQDILLSATKEKMGELKRIEDERKAKEKAEQKAKEEAERKAREEAERKAKEEAERERREREEAERKAKEEAEIKAREEAERLAKEEELRAAALREEEEKARAEEAAALATVKDQVKQHSNGSYALNFENLSPEMLEKLAQDKLKRKNDEKNAIKPAGTHVDQEDSTDTNNAEAVPPVSAEDAEESNNSDSGDEVPETPEVKEPDYFGEVKQQWAVEKANKARWAAIKAKQEEEEKRRKKELSEAYSKNVPPDNK